MAKQKEKTLREKVIENVAVSTMVQFDLPELTVAKEGLVLAVDGEVFVIKVIQKKTPILQGDVKGMFVLAEMLGAEDATESEDISEADEWADEE
jgi:hypothetical protein